MNPFYIIFSVLWCSVQCFPADIRSNLTTCASVKPIFETKNVSTRVPEQTIDGRTLAICKADKSCCTSDMETNLMNLVKRDYQSLLQQNAQSVQGILASTALHFRDYIYQMLLKSELRTKKDFRDLYGVFTDNTNQIIKQFYADLNQYITNKTEIENSSYRTSQNSDLKNMENKLGQITSSFFVKLFPSILQITLGSSHEFQPDFKQCLQNHTFEINPFSEITKSLEKDISKTFEASKVLIDALDFGSQMLNFSNLVILSESSSNVHQCYEALLKMSYCSRCNGHPISVRPCSGYCLNVMRGCLSQQAAELDSTWYSFYESIDKLISLVNRGQSLVCLEDLLRSLHSRIAEPIQYFKEHTENIHSKVKYFCGQVRWMNIAENGQIKAILDELTKLPDNSLDWNADEENSNIRSSVLSSRISQFKDSVPKSKGFYSSLAETLCADDSYAETRETASCWNGQRVAEYAKTVLPIQISSQKYNPEVPFTSQSISDARITEMVEKLRHMKQLVLSQVVMNPESDSLYQLSEDGSGSGSGPISMDDQLTDDEDDQNWRGQGSGSGEMPVTISDISDGSGVRVNPELRNLPKEDVTPTDYNKPTNNVSKGTGDAHRWSCNMMLIAVCTFYWITL